MNNINNVNEFFKLGTELNNLKNTYANIIESSETKIYNGRLIEDVDIRLFDSYPVGIDLGKLVFSAYVKLADNDRRNILFDCDCTYIAPFMKQAIMNLNMAIVEETMRLMQQKKNDLKSKANEDLTKIEKLMES